MLFAIMWGKWKNIAKLNILKIDIKIGRTWLLKLANNLPVNMNSGYTILLQRLFKVISLTADLPQTDTIALRAYTELATERKSWLILMLFSIAGIISGQRSG